MEKEYFEDYEEGEKFVSPGRTITETDVVMFASLTGDWHPIHTNKEYAEKTEFKERVAHGMLTLAIGTALGFRLGPFTILPKSFMALLEFDRVMFLQPVKIGDTIREEVTVLGMSRTEKHGKIHVGIDIVNQAEEIVLKLETKYLCGTRPKEISNVEKTNG